MTVYYADERVTLHHGDALDVLRALPDASIDAVCTDPPYNLSFMGKAWDNHTDGKGFQAWCELWAVECLRVLKPGGHLLAFGGTRTWHRLAVAVEDAGFEIRDSIAWLHAQGFPKSLNVGKDKTFCQCQAVPSSHDGDVRGVRSGVQPASESRSACEVTDVLSPVQRGRAGSRVGDARAQGTSGVDGRLAGELRGEDVWPTEPGVEGWSDVQPREGELRRPAVRPLPGGSAGDGPGGWVRDGASPGDGAMDRPTADEDRGGEPHQPRSPGQPQGEPRAVSVERGPQAGRGRALCAGCGKPAAPAGLGTALKPAFEPIVVGRKPLVGTVAGNVLTHGTGAINVDACRVGADVRTNGPGSASSINRVSRVDHGYRPTTGNWAPGEASTVTGRWPANVVLDDTQAAALDQQSGTSVSRVGMPRGAANGDGWGMTATGAEYNDAGGASRFFPTFRYQAKAPSRERVKTDDGIAHPTVKPLELMRWLVRLVTPPGGVVLEPFAGSGTTVEACLLEGFRCIAIEREADYLPLIDARIARATPSVDELDAPTQGTLL